MKGQLDNVNNSLRKKFKNKELVFGKGYAGAKVVFVGEPPSPRDDNEGKLMSRQSEKALNKLLKSAGLDKRKIYFTNVIKYGPTPNKAYTMKEIKASAPFLREELKTIKPQIVVTLGTLALTGIGFRQPLTNVRGKVFNFGNYSLLPTHHPEKIASDPSLETEIKVDLIKLKEALKTQKESEA
jgi:uracil-DNA glycosylase